jgi:chromosome segregation ATPase
MFVTLCGSLGFASAALAGVADDFRDASTRKGCGSIPYSSERSECETRQQQVNYWCKTMEWNCNGLDTTGLRNTVENVARNIANLTQEKEELARKISSAKDDAERRDWEAKLKDKLNQVAAQEAKVNGWKNEIEQKKKTASSRKAIGQSCKSNREGVNAIFRSVESKVANESDVNAKQYVQKLLDTYKAEFPGHEAAISDADLGVQKCEAVINQ